MTQDKIFNDEAEAGIIGACLSSPVAYDSISQKVKSHDFYDFRYRMLFESISELSEAGTAVDAVTVNARYLSKPDTEDLGEFLYTFNPQPPSVVDAYVEIVKNHSISRDVVQAGKMISAIGQDSSLNRSKMISEVNALIEPVLNQAADSGFTSFKDVLKIAIQTIDERFEAGGGLSGISSGFDNLDELTGGLQASDLIVLAGRPSMGKSVMMMALAEHVSKTLPVFVFSLEMSEVMLANRTLSSNSGISFDSIKGGSLIESDWSRLTAATVSLRERNLFIDDRGGASIDEIRARVRIAARKHGCGMVMVDYLTLVQAVGENQNLRVANVSAGLKNMAKELNCPVVALAQLNREVDKRGDKRPMMSDLRDSGAIEQDADLIMFNYLEDKYDKETHMQGILEIIVRKHRNGETGSLWFDFDGAHQRITTRTVALPEKEEKQKSGKVYRYAANE